MKCRTEAYEGNEPYIFLSYCHKDSAEVYPLLDLLSDAGYRVWFDNGNNAGDFWPETIADHLCKARVCLLMVSGEFGKSISCRNEVSLAVTEKIPMLVVRLDTASLTRGVEFLLSGTHQLKKSDFSSNYELIEKLSKSDGLQECNAGKSLLLPMYEEFIEPAPDDTETKKKPSSILVRVVKKTKTKPVKSEPAISDNSELEAHKQDAQKDKRATPPAAEMSEQNVQREEQLMPPAEEVCEQNVQRNEWPAPPAEEVREQFVPENNWISYYTDPENDRGKKIGEERDPDVTVVGNYTDDITVFDDITVVERSVLFIVDIFSKTVYSFSSPEINIGRGRTNHLDLSYSSISTTHAKIFKVDNTYYLRDMQSTNGTFYHQMCLSGASNTVALNAVDCFLLYDIPFLVANQAGIYAILHDGYLGILQNRTTNEMRVIPMDGLILGRDHRYVWKEDGSLDDSVNKVISRAHGKINWDNGYFSYEDFSKNGSIVDGAKIQNDTVFLHDGSELEIKQYRFVFHVIKIC